MLNEFFNASSVKKIIQKFNKKIVFTIHERYVSH